MMTASRFSTHSHNCFGLTKSEYAGVAEAKCRRSWGIHKSNWNEVAVEVIWDDIRDWMIYGPPLGALALHVQMWPASMDFSTKIAFVKRSLHVWCCTCTPCYLVASLWLIF